MDFPRFVHASSLSVVLGFIAACAGNSEGPSSDAGATGGANGTGGASGGATGTGGGSGAAQSCTIQECFRAVSCVLECGQEPISVSCCPCSAPAFDDIRCSGTGGTTGTGGSGGGTGGFGTGGTGTCGESSLVCEAGTRCHCGGPANALCECGEICDSADDCGPEQPVCCNGICTSSCGCYCD
jgi:hypothetical protein